MALSTPPPPPDPPSSGSTTTITTTSNAVSATRPLFPPNPRPPGPPNNNPSLPYQGAFYPPNPHHHPPNSRLPSNPNPNYPHIIPSPHQPDAAATTTSSATAPAAAVLYPVASSGRGFISKQTSASSLTNPLPNTPLYQPRPGLSYPSPRQPFGYSHPDPNFGPGFAYVTGRSTHLPHATASVGTSPVGVVPGVIRGVPVSTASSQSLHKIGLSTAPVSDSNGHKDLRDRNKDDAFVTIRDRKVRISDDASAYALCRSWLRNGFPEENQLPYLDTVRSLPKPLPLSSQDISVPVKMEDDKEVEEDEESVDHFSPEELLQRHIKRAKRVRSRLRVERLQRIARYKTRLALLLPPMVDPHLRNDVATRNSNN